MGHTSTSLWSMAARLLHWEPNGSPLAVSPSGETVVPALSVPPVPEGRPEVVAEVYPRVLTNVYWEKGKEGVELVRYRTQQIGKANHLIVVKDILPLPSKLNTWHVVGRSQKSQGPEVLLSPEELKNPGHPDVLILPFDRAVDYVKGREEKMIADGFKKARSAKPAEHWSVFKPGKPAASVEVRHANASVA